MNLDALFKTKYNSTLKVLNLIHGFILFILYGHKGSFMSSALYTYDDYLITVGVVSVVMVWKNSLDENEQVFI